MPRYRVLPRGENLQILLDDVPTEVVFFATRAVCAASAELAVRTAEQRVRDDLLRRPGAVTDRLSIHVEEVHPVSWWWRRLRPPAGFTFCLQDGEDDPGDEATDGHE